MLLRNASVGGHDAIIVRPTEPADGPLNVPSRAAAHPPPDVLAVLWHRRWIVATTVAIGVALAVLYLAFATPIYTATSRLEVVLGLPQLGGGMDAEARAKNFLNTQSQSMSSAAVLERVVDRPDVRQMRTFASEPDLLGALKKKLVIESGSKDDLITVSLESPDAEEAARIVNLIVEAYVDHQQSRTRFAASEMLKVLQREKEQRGAELAKLREAMLKYKEEHAALSFVDERGNVALQRLAQLSEATTAAQIETMRAAAAYDAAKRLIGDRARPGELANSLVAILPEHAQRDNALDSVREELLRMEVQLRAVEARLGSNHPSLVGMRQAVEGLREKLSATALGLLEQAWVVAVAKELPVIRAFEEQKRQALELNTVAAKYAVLDADVSQAQKVADAMDARETELRLAADGGGLTVNVLDLARVGAGPTSPRKPIVLGGATMASLLLGTCIAFLRGISDKRLYAREDIAAALPVRILCGVPHTGGAGDGGRKRRALLAYLEPTSHAAEVYRVIRTAIQLGTHGPIKTLLITSPDKGDGKSTVASNLAIVLAQAGERVLLVDADLRAPTIHEMLQVPGDIGIISVLRREQRLSDAIQQTAFARLDVLPCGPIPKNPSEVINTRRFDELLRALSQHYDRVIFDAPPARLADPLILSARCDATLLVVRAGRTTAPACGAAYGALAGVRARILGAVVNDVRSKSTFYGSWQDAYAAGAQTPPMLEDVPVDDLKRFGGAAHYRTDPSGNPSGNADADANGGGNGNGNGNSGVGHELSEVNGHGHGVPAGSNGNGNGGKGNGHGRPVVNAANSGAAEAVAHEATAAPIGAPAAFSGARIQPSPVEEMPAVGLSPRLNAKLVEAERHIAAHVRGNATPDDSSAGDVAIADAASRLTNG